MKALLIILTFIFPLLISAQVSGEKFDLKIQLDSLTSLDRVFLIYTNTSQLEIGNISDSIIFPGKNFEFQGEIPEAWPASLYFYYKQAKGENNPDLNIFNFFLLPGKTTIKVRKNDELKFEGDQAVLDFQALKLEENKQDIRKDSLLDKVIRYETQNDQINKQKTINAYNEYINKITDSIYLGYFISKPNSPLALYSLRKMIDRGLGDPKRFEELYNQLTFTQKKMPSAFLMKEEIEGLKNRVIGKMTEDFIQYDSLGTAVNLKSFLGKFVLVDFWASWCIPCRTGHPDLLNTYEKYKNYNFTIISIALERPGEKENWLTAIKKDHLLWTQVTDFLFWDNAVAKQFGLSSIPFNLLLDPNGKVIAINIRGIDLDLKLNEILL